MATREIKKLREDKVSELYLNLTPLQIQDLYENGKFYELMGLPAKTMNARTFKRDFVNVIKRLAESNQLALTTEDYQAKVEKWKRRLEMEIVEAKDAKQIGVVVSYLDKLMKLDGLNLEGLQPTGDTYVFQNSVIVVQQPQKVVAAEKSLDKYMEAEVIE